MKRILFLIPLMVAACTAADSDLERAEALVSQMTLEEKCLLIAGQGDGFHTAEITRLGIPSVKFADGPQGVRNDTRSTYYPCGVAVAATWNRDLAYGVGSGIGQDARERGVGVMLCPGVNIYRSALCGRNFEYMGEDPYLAGETALNYIKGMQSHGVMATIKHFAANNQEYQRHQVGSLVDERTLNEIYFPTFRKAVEGGVAAVMTSYNPVNGVHAAENSWLVKGNLRAWGFDGIVMSDWISAYSTLGTLTSGVDFEMPKARVLTYEKIRRLVENGVVEESVIDEKCIHILRTFISYGFLDDVRVENNDVGVNEDSRQKAYRAALEAPVLLKNDGLLPFRGGKIAVLGPNADFIPYGGGSGEMFPIEGTTTTVYEGLSALGGEYEASLVSISDEDQIRSADLVVIAAGFDKNTERETRDRTYSLPEGQNELILKACELNDNVLVLVNSGGEIDTAPWLSRVRGFMLTWYLGQEGGRALAELISGAVSPSGRLPFTFWGSLDKNPATPYYSLTPNPLTLERPGYFDDYPYTQYDEGIFAGYRGIEHFGVDPLYPFGYGLTYSSFKYSDLKIKKCSGGVRLSFSVRNTGDAQASEVAQLYVGATCPKVLRPRKELKGYEKLTLAPGESSSVEIQLCRDAFARYDAALHDWTVDPGDYRVEVGSSSLDTKLSDIIRIK